MSFKFRIETRIRHDENGRKIASFAAIPRTWYKIYIFLKIFFGIKKEGKK